MPRLQVKDLIQISRVTALATRFKDLQIMVKPIRPEDAVLLMFVDAAH